MKKKLADMVFKNVNPPDYKTVLTTEDIAEILVQRLGVQRKQSRARHSKLLKFLLHSRRSNIPVDIETIAKVLEVSQSQSYEEIRKWRTLRILEFVKVPVKDSDKYMKGYMLGGATVNQLIDKAQSSANAFFRETRRIAKDFDDRISAEAARDSKQT